MAGFLGIHPGSWLGLPDYGLTEYLGKKISGSQTTDLSDAASGNFPVANQDIYLPYQYLPT